MIEPCTVYDCIGSFQTSFPICNSTYVVPFKYRSPPIECRSIIHVADSFMIWLIAPFQYVSYSCGSKQLISPCACFLRHKQNERHCSFFLFLFRKMQNLLRKHSTDSFCHRNSMSINIWSIRSRSFASRKVDFRSNWKKQFLQRLQGRESS